MNRNEIMALFARYDDPVRWEYPATFDRKLAISRFREFVHALDAITSTTHQTETESDIQDASFHSQVNLGSGWLRFSNFGNMTAITPGAEVDEALVSTLHTLCEKRGYVLIPADVAELPYTGLNPGVTGIRDWWIRFFDWV